MGRNVGAYLLYRHPTNPTRPTVKNYTKQNLAARSARAANGPVTVTVTVTLTLIAMLSYLTLPTVLTGEYYYYFLFWGGGPFFHHLVRHAKVSSSCIVHVSYVLTAFSYFTARIVQRPSPMVRV